MQILGENVYKYLKWKEGENNIAETQYNSRSDCVWHRMCLWAVYLVSWIFWNVYVVDYHIHACIINIYIYKNLK